MGWGGWGWRQRGGERRRLNIYQFHLLKLRECTLLFLAVNDSLEEANSFCGVSHDARSCISKEGALIFFGKFPFPFGKHM